MKLTEAEDRAIVELKHGMITGTTMLDDKECKTLFDLIMRLMENSKPKRKSKKEA